MKTILITFFCVFLTLEIYAYNFKVDGIFYTIKSANTVEVTYETDSYNSYKGRLVIPSEVTYDSNPYTVVSVSANAFYLSAELISVTIPYSVISIGNNAFGSCKNLTFINIQALVPPTTGINVFKWVKEPYVLVPEGCKNDYLAASWGSICRIVEDGPLVTIHNTTAGELSQTLLNSGCSPLSGIVRLKVSGFINNVDFIQIGVNYTSLISLDLSDAIVTDQTIPAEAFKSNTLLYSFRMPENVTIIGNYAFSECTALQGNLQLPFGLKSIGSCAFQGCKSLNGNLDLPNSLATIGWKAFYGCTGFTGDIVIPSSVTLIEPYTFGNCSGFDGVLTISGPVTSIGEGAFLDCYNLTGNLNIPNTVISTGNLAFSGCKGFNGKLYIGSSTRIIGSSSFSYCSGFTGDLVLPDSVIDIGNFTFSGCTGFNGGLYLSKSLTSIGIESFNGCSSLIGPLNIPATVTSIGASAFFECTGLSGNLIIPDGVSYIGAYAFSGCNRFDGVLRIPLQASSLGAYVFEGCTGFSELQIEKNTSALGNYAFGGCTGIRKIAVARAIPPFAADNTFNGISKETCQIIVPTGSSLTYKTTNVWSGFIYYSESDSLVSVAPEVERKIKIYSVSGGVVVEGISRGEEVILYDLNGILLKKTKSNDGKFFISAEPGAVYIVKTSEIVSKILCK